MRELFPVWKNLAEADKIQILHASVTDSRVKDALLAQWPDYGDHVNVVYHSNVLDHLVDDAYPTDVSPSSSLHESFWITNLDKRMPAQVAALNQWEDWAGQALFIHTLRMLNYKLRLEVGGIQDVHPLDFAYTRNLQNFIKFLPNPVEAESRVDYQRLALSNDRLAYLVTLYTETTALSQELVLLSAKTFSTYISMYNMTRSAAGKNEDWFEWLERRFGSVLVELVKAYDDSTHSSIIHA